MIYSDIRRNKALAERRHPMFDKNRFAKFFTYFIMAFWAGYLIMFGCVLPKAFNEAAPNMEPYHIFNSGMIFLLLVDFLARFLIQKTPLQEVKPYLLFPLKKHTVLNCLLIQAGLNWGNLFWNFMLIPFSVLTIFKFYSFAGAIGFLLDYWLLIVANNYWYLFCRTLINEKISYVLVPLLFYGLIGLALFLPGESPLFDWMMNFGEGFILWNPLSFLICMAWIVILFFANQQLQAHLIYDELAKTEDTKLKNVSELNFFGRFGITGEYLKLEIKSQMRNKMVKSQMRIGLFVMLLFSVALSFSDIYNGMGWATFICVYNLSVFGLMTLPTIMGIEGNYMDGLMSREESILSLLKAKYYFNCAITCIPFILMIIPVSKGKITLLMAVAYFFFTVGILFCLLFQFAVYNKNSVELNTKIMGKNKTGTFYQSLMSGLIFFLPISFNKILTLLLGETTALWVILTLGVIGFVLHPLWLRNIYSRLMKRRYINMEGFRNSK